MYTHIHTHTLEALRTLRSAVRTSLAPPPDPRGARPWGWNWLRSLCYLTQTNKSSGHRFPLPTPYSIPLLTPQRGQVISVFHKLKAAAVAVAAKVMKTEERKKKRHLDCNRSVSVEQADHPHCEWEKRSTRKWPSAVARWEVRKGEVGQPGAMGPLSQCTNTKRNATIKRFKFAAFMQQKQSQRQWQRRSNRKRRKKMRVIIFIKAAAEKEETKSGKRPLAPRLGQARPSHNTHSAVLIRTGHTWLALRRNCRRFHTFCDLTRFRISASCPRPLLKTSRAAK